jgi:hypothetical protein
MFAQYALPGTILVGGLGAVILCLVLFVYGFRSDPEDEGPSPARRLLVIRLGHALAAACFAAVVMLSTVALIEQRRVAAAPPPRVALPPTPEVERLHAEVRTLESRLTAAELRLGDIARERVALGSAGGGAEARPVAAPPASRPRKATTPPARRAPASPAVDNDASPARVRDPGEAASARQPPSPGAAVAEASPPADDLGARFREDWETVKRGFREAGEDVRSGVEGLGRRMKALFTRRTD